MYPQIKIEECMDNNEEIVKREVVEKDTVNNMKTLSG